VLFANFWAFLCWANRYEDAERDCTTVIGLDASNVKALFRRGQARVGTGNFLEAQNGIFKDCSYDVSFLTMVAFKISLMYYVSIQPTTLHKRS